MRRKPTWHVPRGPRGLFLWEWASERGGPRKSQGRSLSLITQWPTASRTGSLWPAAPPPSRPRPPAPERDAGSLHRQPGSVSQGPMTLSWLPWQPWGSAFSEHRLSLADGVIVELQRPLSQDSRCGGDAPPHVDAHSPANTRQPSQGRMGPGRKWRHLL